MTAASAQAHELRKVHPVKRPGRLGQSVYEALLKLVVAGRLRPRQHLVETELARQLGVSRQPVREALQRLQQEGWVEFGPKGGAFVHDPSVHEVDELLAVRALLEVEAARLAAPRASERQLDRLLGICSDGEAAVRDSDLERFSSANYGFHAAFAELAGNRVLAQLWRVVAQRARWHYHKVVPVRMRDSCAEHQEIAQAIAARDEGRAAGAALIHMEQTRTAYHRDQVGS
jgi:DNA-binding GntR family transcriptional regulator